MPDLLGMLAEAQIRDWERRQAAGETIPAPGETPLDSHESQLFAEILALRAKARASRDGGEAADLLRRAELLRLQLIIPLERDHPRRALALDAELAARDRDRDPRELLPGDRQTGGDGVTMPPRMTRR